MAAPQHPQHPQTRTETAPVGTSRANRSAIVGAIFLMATSAIGPGFITQTATFTVAARRGVRLRDRAVGARRHRRADERLAGHRRLRPARPRARQRGRCPGVGYLLAGLVVLGGLVFNIGNVAGTGLGTNAMFGLDPRIGGAVSAALAIGIFLSKKAGVALDRVVILLGLVMIVATLVIAVTSAPPVGDALVNVVLPETFDFVAVTTIIGGTVGGYITYAGAHRLLDSGHDRTRARPGHHPQLGRRDPGDRRDAGAAVPGHPRRGRRRRHARHRRPRGLRVPGRGR